MNPVADPQPNLSSTCDLHPNERFSGFCPLCLFERLTTLDQSSPSASASSSRRPSTSAAATIRALFKLPAVPDTFTKSKPKPPSFSPELRRSHSFSASKNDGYSGVFEPQRKSCDVRARNANTTLVSLFTTGNEENKGSSSSQNRQIKQNTSSNSVASAVEDDDDEIRVLEEPNIKLEEGETSGGEIIEEVELKRMKDHIEMDSQPKKASARFWSAASVFSKRWQNWRRKQNKVVNKSATAAAAADSSALPVEKPISRQYRETQSEIAEYGFGRRSCDMDPRFSLDAGRISFDDPRYSFDEPRPSWDGHMIGRTLPRLPPMLSVVEDAPVHVSRSDAYVPLDESVSMSSVNKDELVPGGSIQTKEYYADSSSRRRKSFDRSNSIRRTAAAIVAGIDESKANSNSNSNSKVSPATIDSFSGSKNNFSNSLKDDSSGSFGLKENASVNGNGERKDMKKSKRWNWNIWGLIQKRGNGNGNGNGIGGVNRDEDGDKYKVNRIGIERSYSQSWQESRGENVESNPRMNRSNSSVSWRNMNNNGGSFSSGRKSNVETGNNGLARFYFGSLSGSRRSEGWKSKPNGSNSIGRNVLRMY